MNNGVLGLSAASHVARIFFEIRDSVNLDIYFYLDISYEIWIRIFS